MAILTSLLQESRDRIADPACWLSGESAKDATDTVVRPQAAHATRWSAEGALFRTYYLADRDYAGGLAPYLVNAISVLNRIAKEQHPDVPTFMAVERYGHAAVLAIYDMAIAYATEKDY